MSELRAFTIKTFCETHSVGRTRIYEEIKAGRLRAKKYGAKTIITARDADAWMSSLPDLKKRSAS